MNDQVKQYLPHLVWPPQNALLALQELQMLKTEMTHGHKPQH